MIRMNGDQNEWSQNERRLERMPHEKRNGQQECTEPSEGMSSKKNKNEEVRNKNKNEK